MLIPIGFISPAKKSFSVDGGGRVGSGSGGGENGNDGGNGAHH